MSGSAWPPGPATVEEGACPVCGSDSCDDPKHREQGEPRRLRTVRELMANPELLRLPEPVVPRVHVYRGRTTAQSGLPKIGKSTQTAQASAEVAKGGEFLYHPVERGRVLWFALEEHVGDVARRFAGYGVDVEDAEDIFIATAADLDLKDPAQSVGNWVEQYAPTLYVVDTLQALMKVLAPESGSASAWTPTVQGLTDVSRQTNAAGWIQIHARKSDGRYRDSGAIAASVDVVVEMFAEKIPNERRFEVMGRFGTDLFTLAFVDGLYVPLDVDDRTVAERIIDYVRVARPDPTTNEVCKTIGGRKTATKSILDELVDRRVIDRYEDGSAKRHRIPAGSPAQPMGLGLGTGAGSVSGNRVGTSAEPAGTGPGTGRPENTREPVREPVEEDEWEL